MLKREGTYVYTKERTRVPSLKQGVQYVLYEKNRGFEENVYNYGKCGQSEVQIGPPMRKSCGKEGPCFDIDGQAIDTGPGLPIPVNKL